jgi:thiol-disulfide isomerase/thioredoxin
LDSIIQKYKGKVIYIDFWAPWCGPCMAEMPDSKVIQNHFKDKDVVFLFLANRCKEDAWKSTIANKKLTGEHLLLSDRQFSSLSKIFEVNGIPHYSLINEKGKIVMKNAHRPSQEDLLTEKISSLLGN